MAATLGEITAGLKANLATISGLRTFDYVPDNFAAPCAIPMFESVEYYGSFAGGNPRYRMKVTVIVGRTSERAAQHALDDYLSYSGDRSILAAVTSDTTLGGKAQTLIVESANNIRMITQGDASFLAVDFDVLVHA